jgi:hypothetical protein
VVEKIVITVWASHVYKYLCRNIGYDFYELCCCMQALILSFSAEVDAGSPKNDIPLTLRVRAAIGTALGATAARAKLLADQEEREIEHLVATIIEAQVASSLIFYPQFLTLLKFF